MDWFLYDNGLRHEGVKGFVNFILIYYSLGRKPLYKKL